MRNGSSTSGTTSGSIATTPCSLRSWMASMSSTESSKVTSCSESPRLVVAGSRFPRASVLAVALILTACRTKEPPPVSPPCPAPDSFRVTFETSKGTMVVQVNRAWAPHGADRFYHLASEHFFDDVRFFRVLPRYIAQFGLTDDRKANEKWRSHPIPDDSLVESKLRGTLSFAGEGPHSPTHQRFVNLTDIPRLANPRLLPPA